MVIPFLSVAATGLIVGAGFYVARPATDAMWRGFFGAWAGFAAGALIGLALDVAGRTEHWVPLLGHIGAIVGAVWAQQLDLIAPDSQYARVHGSVQEDGGSAGEHPRQSDEV